jgi:hypothetical protein
LTEDSVVGLDGARAERGRIRIHWRKRLGAALRARALVQGGRGVCRRAHNGGERVEKAGQTAPETRQEKARGGDKEHVRCCISEPALDRAVARVARAVGARRVRRVGAHELRWKGGDELWGAEESVSQDKATAKSCSCSPNTCWKSYGSRPAARLRCERMMLASFSLASVVLPLT